MRYYGGGVGHLHIGEGVSNAGDLPEEDEGLSSDSSGQEPLPLDPDDSDASEKSSTDDSDGSTEDEDEEDMGYGDF